MHPSVGWPHHCCAKTTVISSLRKISLSQLLASSLFLCAKVAVTLHISQARLEKSTDAIRRAHILFAVKIMSRILAIFLVLVVLQSVIMLASSMRTSRLFNTLTSRRGFSVLKAFTSAPSGATGTTDYRLNFHKDGQPVSPWHDIPYKEGEFYHTVIEIPKYTKAKMEISTKENLNPIAQDIKKGKLRDYHGPIFWNYGAIPQTWENPNVVHPDVKCKGDNDPVDVVEIGSAVIPSGTVIKTKVLGVLAMIDDGELDWKVIGINADDPLAKDLHDIADVEARLPGVVSGIREWFRWYKTPDDKPLNAFGYEEKALSKKVAVEVIEETHHHWKDLMSGKADKGKLWTK